MMHDVTIAISSMSDNYKKNTKLFLADKVNYLIVNQCDKNFREEIHENFTILNVHETGLSKSRNRAIDNAIGKWIIFADDDLDYSYFSVDKIKEYIRDSDILLISNFDFTGPKFKTRKATFSDMMKCASWCIVANLQKVKDVNLRFDEKFGLGAEFISTEENSFLLDAKKKGLIINCTEETLVNHVGVSTGFNWTAGLIISKGAFIRRNFKKLSILFLILFSIKKFRNSDYDFYSFLSHSFRGWIRYGKIDK